MQRSLVGSELCLRDRFRTERALAMGFKADPDFESIVRDHIALGSGTHS
jgi:hypothetical protein